MKIYLKSAIALALGFVLIYTACKKLKDAPASHTVSEQVVAGLVGKTLMQSLAGQHGGVNLREGIRMPSLIVHSLKGPIVNSLNPICGYKLDTVVNYNINIGDTITSTAKGRFSFTYTCSTTTPDGYISSSNITNTGQTPSYSFTYLFSEDFTVKALNPQYTQVSLDGSMTSLGDFKFKVHSPYIDSNFLPKPIFEHDHYVLTGLKIDVTNNFDIISGTTTFTSKGSNAYGTWDYEGTITYSGNHMAIITINGKAYKVNLLTGEVTPI